MRRSKQLILTILITGALMALAWSAGTSVEPIDTVRVVAAKETIAAGSMICEGQIMLLDIPADLMTETCLADLSGAVGSFTMMPIAAGEILSCDRLLDKAYGIAYPEPGPGRRLLSLNLKAAEANGFWLAAGSLVDLYLMPRGADAALGVEIIENIRIMGIALEREESVEGELHPAGSGLICFDVSREQADAIIEGMSRCDIRLSAVNEVALSAVQ